MLIKSRHRSPSETTLFFILPSLSLSFYLSLSLFLSLSLPPSCFQTLLLFFSPLLSLPHFLYSLSLCLASRRLASRPWHLVSGIFSVSQKCINQRAVYHSGFGVPMRCWSGYRKVDPALSVVTTLKAFHCHGKNYWCRALRHGKKYSYRDQSYCILI